MYSIRDRLLWTFAVVLLLASVAATYLTFVSARSEVDRFLDMHLQQVAISLQSHPISDITQYEEQNFDSERIVIQVVDNVSQKSFISHNIEPFPIKDAAGFSNIRHEGETWRIYTQIGQNGLVVITGQPTSIRVSSAFSSALHILQPLVLLLPFFAIAIWLVVGQGLSSLNRTAKLVSQRSPSSLEPIPCEHLPVEVQGLVNELNTLLQRLKLSLEAQKRFASDAAHELRTPLTAIKLQAQMAQRAKSSETQQKALNRLNDGIDRATGLVQQLLTIARLDPDATKKPFHSIAVENVLSAVADEMSEIANNKKILIELDNKSAQISGIEDALKLLITNLTDNAIRYTPIGGRIRLGSETLGSIVRISVSDNGPGIAPEERERVFDRFYRALGTHTQGHGLGLAIVKRIVEIHQGSIRIEDGLDGVGTSMVIELPLSIQK